MARNIPPSCDELITTDGKCLGAAHNAARGKVVSHALDHNGNEVMLVNGKPSPALNRLANYVGVHDAAEFLLSQGHAVSVHSLKK